MTVKTPLESELVFPGEDGLVDLDLISGKLEALAVEIETYRASLLRHISARRDLLGKHDPPENSQTGIPQLLEIKENLDREFRERFRLSGDFIPRTEQNNGSPGQARDYTSGR